MSKNRQPLGYGVPAKSPEQRTVTAPVSAEVKEMVEVIDHAVRTATKDQSLHRAVILCLNLLLTTARYGGIRREAEDEIVEAIASLE